MADETKDEEIDVFEIDDFTAASEWERFIYRIEEIMGPHGWKLNNNDKKASTIAKKDEDIKSPSPGESFGASLSCSPSDNREQIDWNVESESLKFGNFNFTLSHHNLRRQVITLPKGGSDVLPRDESGSEGVPQALLDSFDVSYDFPPRAHCLSRWYGVKEFILLSPTNKDESIDSESRTNLLWSSVGVALSNLKCQIPVFIQIGNWRRRLHYGMCVGRGFRTSFEMIHLQYTPRECNYVHGMIETFKAKIARPLTSSVHVSIRFTYIIKNWPLELCWPQPSSVEVDDSDEEEHIMSYNELPLGSISEPINDLQFAVSWPSISSDMLNDDSNFSDLNPEHAPQWWLKVRCFDIPDVSLYKHLKALLHLSKQSSASTAQIIRTLSMDNEDFDGSSDVSLALNRLVEPSHILQNTVSNAARRVMKTRLSESPIPEVLLRETLEHLFPDANKTKEEALLIQTKLSDEQKTLECDAIRNRDQYRTLKSAPVNSLTYNIALCICTLNYAYGGVRGIAHLWHEFVLEMRYRFENNILIPGLAQTIPNLNYCLVHQKLQMLNCCIQKRQEREERDAAMKGKENADRRSSVEMKTSVSYKDFEQEIDKVQSQRDTSWNDLLANIEREPASEEPGGEESSKGFTSSSSDKLSSFDDSDDEFFEAQEEITSNPSVTNTPTIPGEPEGVLEESSMKLLLVDKALCIPITQQPPPLTEDVLLEQQEVMTQLGTSQEAARVRAQMQSASLVSDMEAFKAANPGCILEDFVRWYSPNDWLPGPETEEEKMELNDYLQECGMTTQKSEGWEFELDEVLDDDLIETTTKSAEFSEEGHMSLRMRAPGNTWEELWASTHAVPVRRQKRLFDDTKEAEKVLHFLSSLRPCEIALQFFPVIIHACIVRINKEEDCSKVTTILENVVKEASRIQTPSLESYRLMESVVKDLLKAETILERMQSLRIKFYPDSSSAEQKNNSEIEQFIHTLLNCSEVAIKGCAKTPIGKIIKSLLINEAYEEQSTKTENTSQQVNNRFPSPSGREYILRTTLSLPSASSRSCPQRMFTVITPEEFRMAGSFTHDTNFL